MSNNLIPEDQFQTAVPSNNGEWLLRSTNTESPSNNDLLGNYGITQGEPLLPTIEYEILSSGNELIGAPSIISDIPLIDANLQYEYLSPGSSLIPDAIPIETIPVLFYTEGTCFKNMSSEALITTREELFIYLCDVLIRFDSNPIHYQKEDFTALIRTLVGSLIYLYDVTHMNTHPLSGVPFVGVATLSTNPMTFADEQGYVYPGIYIASQSGYYSHFGGVEVTQEEIATSAVLLVPIITNELFVGYGKQVSQINPLVGNTASTGATEISTLSIVDSTHFSVASVKGWIINNEVPTLPTAKYIDYSGINILCENITTNNGTYLLINSNNELEQQLTYPTPTDRKQKIFIGYINHSNRQSIISITNNVDITISAVSQLRDILTTLPLINDGIRISPYGSAPNIMSLVSTEGYLYGLGINPINQLDSNRKQISANNLISFRYYLRNGELINTTTVLNPMSWDDNGVLTLVGNPSKQATNQRIYILPDGQFCIQYGQTKYANLIEALNGVATELFIPTPEIKNYGVLIGIISFVANTNSTDGGLTNTLKVSFTPATKFGDIISKNIEISTLQTAYNNSTIPQITTSVLGGAVTLKRGSSNDTDSVLQIMQGNGTVSGTINGLGEINFSKVQVTNATGSQFLKGDGTLDNNAYALSNHTHDEVYQSIMGTGVKITGQDAGTFGHMSLTDDFVFLCVLSGDSSTAIWKKVVLFQSI